MRFFQPPPMSESYARRRSPRQVPLPRRPRPRRTDRLSRNLTAAPEPFLHAVQHTGVGNEKAGNAWLKWAFSEAAVLGAQKDERIGALLQRLASKLGKAKAYLGVAHQLGRAFLSHAAHEGGF